MEKRKIVAIASSTGGPKALQEVIPKLSAQIDAPILVVQHMPPGFTASLAERLDKLSMVRVTEAKDGDVLEKGHVYIAPGGQHMVISKEGNKAVVRWLNEEPREGVKPCANYMFESLADSQFDRIVCVVMTGMGADGTEGIENLKKKKLIHVINQDKDSSVVYGMPKMVRNAGLSDEEVALNQIADAIHKHLDKD